MGCLVSFPSVLYLSFSLSPLSHSFFLLLGSTENIEQSLKPTSLTLQGPYISVLYTVSVSERRVLNHCTSPRSSKKEILATLTLLCMVLPFFFKKKNHSPLKVDTHRCELVCDSVSTHGNRQNRFSNSGPRPLPSCFKGNHLSLREVIRKLCGQSLKRQSDRAALSHGVSIS